jgi:type I restriction enzyme M protein
MPDRLFFNTGIPVCLWFVSKDRAGSKFRDRRGEVLFIDARRIGEMVTRTLRDYSIDDLNRIAGTYHAWRDVAPRSLYQDVAGFCRSAGVDEIASHEFILTPGRYVGAEELEDDGELLEAKVDRLRSELYSEFEEGARLEGIIRDRLSKLTS